MKWARSLRPMIPRGVQCYFGEEVSRRRRMEAVVAGIMKSWGFQEIILPFFDYLEDFSYGLGSQLGDRVYRFLDKDGSLLALRPDLTTLVAKTVATRMTEHSLPVKLFYSGEVFRQERTGAGHQKEFYQIGLESMGVASTWADIEALLLAIDCLLHLGVDDFKIALGHVGFFTGIVSGLNLSSERADALRDAIDHKDCARLQKEVEGLDLSDEKKSFLIHRDPARPIHPPETSIPTNRFGLHRASHCIQGRLDGIICPTEGLAESRLDKFRKNGKCTLLG